MKCKELLGEIFYEITQGSEETQNSSLVMDSRKVKEGAYAQSYWEQGKNREKRDNKGKGCLRSQAFNGPTGVVQAAVEKTVVQAAGLSLPEFHRGRNNPVASPEIRQGNFTLKKLLLGLFKLLQEQLTRRNDLALPRHPGSKLALPGAAGKIAG